MDQTSENPLPNEILETIRLIGRKWSVVVLHELTHEPLSFGELKEKIPGVSASVLSDLLTEFQEKEIIEKRSISVSPQRSAYFISEFGQVLCKIIESISDWGAKLVSQKQGSVSVTRVNVQKTD
ncbi:MAG: winged helix-turn-helix transcriptional regulator [Candidatus Kariarchaeaceae archaeon]|jgi:DNA-binding HxlR family transcriptional regulator